MLVIFFIWFFIGRRILCFLIYLFSDWLFLEELVDFNILIDFFNGVKFVVFWGSFMLWILLFFVFVVFVCLLCLLLVFVFFIFLFGFEVWFFLFLKILVVFGDVVIKDFCLLCRSVFLLFDIFVLFRFCVWLIFDGIFWYFFKFEFFCFIDVLYIWYLFVFIVFL